MWSCIAFVSLLADLLFSFAGLCAVTDKSRSAAAILNPNQGKEQFIQTPFFPPFHTAATP